jgi:hypothetical protein
MQLVQVEEAFETLEDGLALWPVHQRLEAHIFVAFLATRSTRHSGAACASSRLGSRGVLCWTN